MGSKEKWPVRSLCEYRNGMLKQRQDEMRECCQMLMVGDDAPAAGIFIGVRPSGEIVSVTRNIEPEHICTMIVEIAKVIGDMHHFGCACHKQ